MTTKPGWYWVLCLLLSTVVQAEPLLPKAIIGQAPALEGQAVAYFPDDPHTKGYLAQPATGSIKGGVLLIHEWDGLTLRIKETADAFAEVGYAALAVDLYSGKIGNNRSENIALIQATRADPDRIRRNLNAALLTLGANPEVKGRIASIGWCFGGGIALNFAVEGELHEGTAIFYGQLLDDPEALKHIHHEVYGTFAGLDQGPSIEQVNRFVSALRSAGVPNDVHIYDNVQHGFWLHVDRDPANNEAPAKDAWSRLLHYLDRVLTQPAV